MKRQHQFEDSNWFGRQPNREQRHDSNLPHHHLYHNRQFTVPGHFRDSEKETGNLALPVQMPAAGSNAAAEAFSGIKQRHSPSNAYFTYNAGGGENRKYTITTGRIIKKAGNDTGTGANIYLGGRTSSYGPTGYGAEQKQYGFARYSGGSKKDETPESN